MSKDCWDGGGGVSIDEVVEREDNRGLLHVGKSILTFSGQAFPKLAREKEEFGGEGGGGSSIGDNVN